ncbi:InlB B-repeat-containing protein [Lachnospiraceae bacterium 54-53]
MRKRVKRILSLCLAAVIVATSAGYSPPVVGAAMVTLSASTQITEHMATPSEATPSEEKSTPSEAESKFVRVDPEEIPEYYSRESKSGTKFWKFEDRNGNLQYRDYGFIQGEAEFPLWYETDQTGTVEDLGASVNLDEEYYDLAPYLYISVEPGDENWKELELLVSIDLNNSPKEVLGGFENWDRTQYGIWSLKTGTEPVEDLGFFFYGSIPNADESGNCWRYSDRDGNIGGKVESQKLIYKASLYANEQTVTLTLHGEGGTVYGEDTYTLSLDYETDIRSLLKEAYANAIRTGYKMYGSDTSCWYYGPNGTGNYFSNVYNGDWKIREDLDLYAYWKPVSYRSDFYYKLDHSSSYSTYADYGDYVKVTAGVPPKIEGYIFLGWYTEKTGGYKLEENTVVQGAEVNKFYAHYAEDMIEITFDDNISGKPHTTTVNTQRKGTISNLNITEPTRDYYWGIGWNDKPDGSGKKWTSISEMVGDSIILYQMWQGKDTIIRFYNNTGDEYEYQASTLWVKYGDTIGDKVTELPVGVNGDKVFLGWYTEKTGGNEVNLDSVVINESIFGSIPGYETDPYFGEIKLYAHYVRSSYSVTFADWNGTVIDVQDVAIGADAAPPADPARIGYTFTGWDKPSANIQADTVITAQYSINSYQLILDGNGGTVNGSLSQERTIVFKESYDQELIDGKDSAVREGYTFAGWYTVPEGGTKYADTGNTMPAAEVTVYAHWVESNHTVIYKDWDGRILDEQSVIFGTDATPPPAPARPGYTFTGWDKPSTNIQADTVMTAQYIINRHKLILDGNGGNIGNEAQKEQEFDYNESFDQALTDGKDYANRKFYTFDGWYTAPSGGSKYPESGNQIPDADLTVYAHWVRSSSEVIYQDWDGREIDKQKVAIGADAAPPADPVRTGYTFTGWDKTSTKIQDHTIITAQYGINNYKLILDGNGGTIGEESLKEQEFDYGESFDQALADAKDHVSRKYYTFDGWYTAPSGDSKYPESGNQMPDADVTVYAHWIRSSSLVTYKDWTGNTIDAKEVAIGADATPPAAPERPGYTFSGWDKPSTNIEDHTIITAQYTINGYLLILDGNGGTIDGESTKEQVLSYDDFFDQILTDGRDKISRPGYTFEGWYTEPEGGSNYSYTGNKMPAEDVTVYAHWTVNTYEVTFDPDHVRWDGGVTQRDYTFDTMLGTLPAPEIYGWEFTGWWTGKNGSGTKITDETMVEPRDAAYYGSWKPVTYQIEYISRAEQPGGESVQTFTRSQEYDHSLGALPEPEEKGYTFTGWYDENNEKVSAQTIFSPDSGAEECTYYAGWAANTYKIRFIYNDSNGIPVIIEFDGTYHTQIGEFPVPEKPGYIFIGWYKDNGEEITSGSWVEAGDAEYKARWKADQYTISFKRNLSGSMEGDPEDKTVTYGMPIGELPILHEKGYVFLEWYTNAVSGSRIKETTLAALGDQTYYAHWTTGWIDNGNGTYSRPGTDGTWNTEDDEIWWNGPDGISGTDDDKIILIGGPGPAGKPIYYVDNGDGTHIRPGTGGNWNIGDTEHWWNGSDGQPGTDNDKIIIIGGPGQDGKPIYYVDNGDGTHIRPGTGGNWNIGDTEHWWNGSDGQPGTDDDKVIHIGGPDPDGDPIHYIDNGDGTHTRPGTDETWRTADDEIWHDGPDGLPGTYDDYKKNPTPEPTEPKPTEPQPTEPKPTEPKPTEPQPTEPKPTEPEPSNPAPTKESEEGSEESTEITTPVIPVIDSKEKPAVPDTGGTFTVNPDNPYEVTYTKPDGMLASDEWVGDGEDWYHVDVDGTLNYDWYLEGQKTWYKLNKELGDKFGAALIGWNYEPMDDKRYFFNPSTGTMLTGWQLIDNEWYYFTKQNEAQTYFGDNRKGWLYDPTKPGKPYGSMYRDESTPDGYYVDENGVLINK